MELLDLVFMAFGAGLVIAFPAWYALLQHWSRTIWAQFTRLPDTLAAMLWVKYAEYVDFLTWACDSVTYHLHQNGLRIGLAYGCWLLLTLHRRPRFWALLPFRYIWSLFLILHFLLWPRSVRYPVERELGPLLPDSVLFERDIEIADTNTDKVTAEDTEAMDTPRKVYKGPTVRSLRSKNGLVNSAPIVRSN
ncbi:hypothetical protein N431DRAFT_463029 [Stipitochalara longipes BDJ]|nr:hypothetical protein N431DRAFT_463029 [Stipitochalara longipes BDJ]